MRGRRGFVTRSVRRVVCGVGGMWLGGLALQLDGLQREKRRASFVFTGEAFCEYTRPCRCH